MTSTTLQQTRPLAGRTAIVTGAASGIGAAIAERLAADGAAVALLSRRTDRLDELAARITKDGGTALSVAVDVTDQDSVDRGVEEISSRLGSVDLLVNAAGVMFSSPIQEGRTEEWARTIDTNVTGVLRLAGAFVPGLIAAAAEGRTADLVNISSIAADGVYPAFGVYSASKAAVTQLSASLRADLSPYDVRVTNLEPGLVDTELRTHVAGGSRAMIDGMFEQLGSLGAEDIADLIAYVVSRRRDINLRHLVALPTRQV